MIDLPLHEYSGELVKQYLHWCVPRPVCLQTSSALSGLKIFVLSHAHCKEPQPMACKALHPACQSLEK